MTQKTKRFIASLLVACALFSCNASTANAKSLYESRADANYFLLQEILDLYVEKSLYETDKETLIEQMLYNFIAKNPDALPSLANAALRANDPYSSYYDSSLGYMSSTNTSFGIIVTDSASFDDDDPKKSSPGVYITEVLKGTNAEFAGLLAGDRIVALEGLNVEGLTLAGVRILLSYFPLEKKDPSKSKIYNEFVTSKEKINTEEYEKYTKLLWNPEREVSFEVERTLHDGSKALIQISVPRGLAPNKNVSLYINKELAIATIEISAFDTDTVEKDFIEAFEEAKNAGCKKLIIDLRDNLGGYFDAAKNIGSLFTQGEKVMFYIKSRDTQEPVPTYSSNNYIGDTFEEYAVLINEATASAAELLAHLLREGVGAAIIGEQSFGKALGQQIFDVSNGDSFTITSFELLTSDKTSYNNIGIIPDHEVPILPVKYEFPTGLSHFNHENYVEIKDGVSNDATLALEQRFGILGIMRESAIDGYCDESTRAAILAFRIINLGNKENSTEITPDFVTTMTIYINGYKDRYLNTDSQKEVALLYLQNHSQGKRLAKECRTAFEKYEKAIAEREERERLEIEKALEEEQNAASEEPSSADEN